MKGGVYRMLTKDYGSNERNEKLQNGSDGQQPD